MIGGHPHFRYRTHQPEYPMMSHRMELESRTTSMWSMLQLMFNIHLHLQVIVQRKIPTLQNLAGLFLVKYAARTRLCINTILCQQNPDGEPGQPLVPFTVLQNIPYHDPYFPIWEIRPIPKASEFTPELYV